MVIMHQTSPSSRASLAAPPMIAWIIYVLAALFYVYDYFIQVSPSVMANQLMSAFNIDATGLAILGSCFYYAYVGMQIPAGMLLDRLGARAVLTVSVFISAIGVLLFAATDYFVIAGIARLLIGLGAAFSFVSALCLVARWFPHRYFAVLSGGIQFGACIGSILGLAPLAAVINAYGYRTTLWVIGCFTLLLVIVYGTVIRNGRSDVTPPTADHQLMSQWQKLKMLLGHRQIGWIALVGCFCWVSVATFGALWGVPYLMKVFSLSNVQAGWLCSLFWLGVGVGSPLVGGLSDYLRSRKIPCYGCFGLGLLGSLLLVCAPYLPLIMTMIGIVLLGSSASIQSLTFGMIKDVVAADRFATAAGIVNMAAIIGGAVAQLVFGMILSRVAPMDLHSAKILSSYDTTTYQMAMLLLPLAMLLGLWITRYGIQETRCVQR